MIIFTGSQVSIFQKDGSRETPCPRLQLRLLYRNFSISIGIKWVPAHVGIDFNERADELTDRGANISLFGREGYYNLTEFSITQLVQTDCSASFVPLYIPSMQCCGHLLIEMQVKMNLSTQDSKPPALPPFRNRRTYVIMPGMVTARTHRLFAIS